MHFGRKAEGNASLGSSRLSWSLLLSIALYVAAEMVCDAYGFGSQRTVRCCGACPTVGPRADVAVHVLSVGPLLWIRTGSGASEPCDGRRACPTVAREATFCQNLGDAGYKTNMGSVRGTKNNGGGGRRTCTSGWRSSRSSRSGRPRNRRLAPCDHPRSDRRSALIAIE